MNGLWQDVRFAWRVLAKNPAFFTVAVLTVILGIASNTVIFSIVNQTLLKPLPYPESRRILQVQWRFEHGTLEDLNGPQAQMIEQRAPAFESVGIMFPAPGCNLVGGDRPDYVEGSAVSTGFFRTLAVQPTVGRDFISADLSAGRAQSVIISNKLWKSRFAGDANIVGRMVHCNGNAYTVVGVLPANFYLAMNPADIFFPDTIAKYLSDTGSNYTVLARLKPDVTMQQAQQQLASLPAQLRLEFPHAVYGQHDQVELKRWQESVSQGSRSSLFMLSGAVGLVLLISCANVAGLLLARAHVRAREMAIRSALGASSMRITRQMLTESVLLNVIGGAIGILVAMWGITVSNAIITKHFLVDAVHMDGTVLAVAVGLSLLVGVASGVVPALQLSQRRVAESLKLRDFDLGSKGAFRKLLVATQVALTLVLLVGSGLLIRSFIALRHVSPGLNPENLTVAELSLSSGKYARTAAVEQFDRAALEHLRSVPGVIGAASITSVPARRDLNLGGRDAGHCTATAISYRAVSLGFFQTMQVPLTGRDFHEGESAPVAVVNEAFAKRCLDNVAVIGKQVALSNGMGEMPREIVGIAADMRDFGLKNPAQPTLYVPQWQVPDGVTKYSNGIFYWSLVVRTANQKVNVPFASIVQGIDPELAVVAIVPVDSILADWLALSRLLMQLMIAFASLALLLSAVGLFGLLSYQVNRRTHEIGVRMALGAARSTVLRMVLGDAMLLIGAGAIAGLVSAFAISRLFTAFVFGVQARDPLAFLVAPLVLLAVGLAASFIPARRATKVDPMIALRYE